ncbi:uncharacterized protein [Diadema antillarum]|uniref:uncharacterized protein n=1 Tax=Diadema antillarum TaxID=105358 RepID=UPI003A83D3FA
MTLFSPSAKSVNMFPQDFHTDSAGKGEKTRSAVLSEEGAEKDTSDSYRSSKECLPPRIQRKKSPSPFPSSSAYPSLRRLALKNRVNAASLPEMTTPPLRGEMTFAPVESPLYGGGQIKINFGPLSQPPEEESEVFLVFEGSRKRHVTSAKRTDYQTYSAIIPGHDEFEEVSLTVCTLPVDCTVTQLRALFDGTFLFTADSTFYLAKYLISSVWDPDSLDSPARIKGENFNLCEEDLSSLDHRLTCAFKHIERPPSWKIVTESPRIDQNPPPRETLLHFAARCGLQEFAFYLLDHPGSDVALKLPNKDGDLAVELARASGLDSLADRMLEQSLCEDAVHKNRRLEHVQGKACVIKRHNALGTATITTNLDESSKTIEDDIHMLRDVVSYMEADEEDTAGVASPVKIGKHARFSDVSPDQGLSDSSSSEDENEEEEEDFVRCREYRGTLEPVLEDSIQQIKTINNHVQALRRENRIRISQGARRESLSRFSTSCPLLTEDKPEVEGWKQKMPSHPGAVTHSDDENDDMDDPGRGSSITSPLSPKTPPIQIQVNDISLDSSGDSGGGVHVIPTISSHHVMIPLAPIATTPEDSSPEDLDTEGGGGGIGDVLGMADREDMNLEKTRRYSWGPEPDDSVREGSDIGGELKLSAASRSKSLMNLDATGKDAFAHKKESGKHSGTSRRDSAVALAKKQNDGYGLDGKGSALPTNNANSSSSSSKSSPSAQNIPVVRRQKHNLQTEQTRKQRSASMHDTRLVTRLIGMTPCPHSFLRLLWCSYEILRSELEGLQEEDEGDEEEEEEEEEEMEMEEGSENDESGGHSSLTAERRRQARLSLTEFLADPLNFTDENSLQQSANVMEGPGRTSVLRKLSFLKVGGQRREKKREKEKDREKEKEEKKEKEKEKERVKELYRPHQFVNSSFSNSTKCNYCEKSLQNKAALQCQICQASVHNNSSCKDNLPSCTKLTKHPKSLSRTSGAGMREKVKANSGLGHSQSLREKTRPNTIVATSRPFQQMSYGQQQGSTPDVRPPLISTASYELGKWHWNRVAIKLGVKTIEENEENDGGPGSPPKQGLGNNNINFSVESLDEVGTSEGWEFMEDEDLVTQGPEPESWSVMVEKKTLKDMSRKEIKRQDVIFEFIKTEKHHLRTLKIMQKIFSYGMQNELNMDQVVIKKVFPMLDELVEIASKFYDNLQKRQKEAEVVERIGDILVDQFDGENGDRMKVAYGCLCSQQNEAKGVYKELTKTDKRFQAFIKKCSTNALCRRWTIPECILSVSSRLTKYQLLIEAIIKPTKESKQKQTKLDTQDLTKALELVKGICNDVNVQVRETERWQRLVEIYNRTEAKSTGTLKSGKKFKKSDLLQSRKLRYEGELYWKSARAKLTEVHGVLLTDVLLLLTESNGKYTFASQDNKPPVIPLFKLMVRDVAIDSKSVYLISPNKAGPEMYEVMCPTEHARKEWKKMLLEAIEECPPEGMPLTFGVDVQNEEDRKAAERRALRIKQLIDMMHDKDKQLTRIMTEKMSMMTEVKELIMKEDGMGSLKIPLISMQENQMDQTRDLILAAMKEANFLTRAVCGGSAGLSRRPTSVGERESGNHGNTALPRRAETFSGFDSAQNGAAAKKRVLPIPAESTTRSSSFPNLTGTATTTTEQVGAFTPPAEEPEGEDSPILSPTSLGVDGVSPLPSPSHRPAREMSLPVGRNRGSQAGRHRASTIIGGVDLPTAMIKDRTDTPEEPSPAEIRKNTDSPAALEHVNAASHILEHLSTLLKITSQQDTNFQILKKQLLEVQNKLEAQNDTKSAPSPKEKRNPSSADQDPRSSVIMGNGNSVTGVSAADKAKPYPVQANIDQLGRSTPPPLVMPVQVPNNPSQPEESSPRVHQQVLTSIAYGSVPPSSNHNAYLHDGSDRARDIGRKNSAPSPRLQESLNSYNSSPKMSSGRTDDSIGRPVTSMSARRNVPPHLMSAANQIGPTAQVKQQLPFKLTKTMSSSSTSVTQMLPKKLESLSSSSSKPNKNANAQPQQTSDQDVIFF